MNCERCAVYREMMKNMVGFENLLCDGCTKDAIAAERERCANIAEKHIDCLIIVEHEHDGYPCTSEGARIASQIRKG